MTYASGAAIRAFAEENWSSTARGTNLRFYTVPNGSTTITERMRIDAAGLISGSGTSLGSWTSYAPTVTAGSGAFTTVSASGRYCQIGKIVFVTANIIITTNGTAASSVLMTLPVNTVAGTSVLGSGRCDAISGKMVQIKNTSASQIAIFTYDNLYPGATGETIRVNLQYEAA